MALVKQGTIIDFRQYINRFYESNQGVHAVRLTLEDGQKPLNLSFESPQGVVEDQRDRKGAISVDDTTLNKVVPISVLYELMLNGFTQNNYVHTITAELDDCYKQTSMTFRTAEGFEQDQTQRRGTIEQLLN